MAGHAIDHLLGHRDVDAMVAELGLQRGGGVPGDTFHVLSRRCANDQVVDLRVGVDAAHALGGNKQRFVGLHRHQHGPGLVVQDAHHQKQVIVDTHTVAQLQRVTWRAKGLGELVADHSVGFVGIEG